MVERGPEQQPRQVDLPIFSDLQFPKMRFAYVGLVPDTAPEGFEPYSNMHVAYDSLTGVRAIVGERRKPHKKHQNDTTQYYILGEDLLPMHEEGLSSITSINPNSVTGKKYKKFGKFEIPESHFLIIDEDAVRMVKGKLHPDSDVKFRELKRENDTDNRARHGASVYTVTDTFDITDLNVYPYPVFAELYTPPSQRKPRAARPIKGETILGVIQRGDYKKAPEPEPKKVERLPTLDELQYPALKPHPKGGWYREDKPNERIQALTLFVDTETRQFALVEEQVVKHVPGIDRANSFLNYILDENLERVHDKPVTQILGFDGYETYAKFRSHGEVYRMSDRKMEKEYGYKNNHSIVTITQDKFTDKLGEGLSGRDIEDLIRQFVPPTKVPYNSDSFGPSTKPSERRPKLAAPYAFYKLRPEIPLEEQKDASQEDNPTLGFSLGYKAAWEREKVANRFVMPGLTPDLKVAQWEEREGRYYPQGIDNHEGYDAIMLLIDRMTKKVLVVGRNGRNDHILDIRTGEELSHVNNFSVREIREDGTVAGIDTIENNAMELDGDKIYANVANRTKKRIEKRNLSEAFVKGNITSFTIKTLARISGSDKDKDIVASLGFETGYKAAWENASVAEEAQSTLEQKFELPKVDEHMKIAKWHKEKGVYYPEGSDLDHGYDRVELYVDVESKQFVLLGERIQGKFILDIQTGKALHSKAIESLKGLKGKNAFVVLPGEDAMTVFSGSNVYPTELIIDTRGCVLPVQSDLVSGRLTVDFLKRFANDIADHSTDPLTLGFESGYRAAFGRGELELGARAAKDLEIPAEEAQKSELPVYYELPKIDEHLKIAKWHTDGNVFYPEGSDPLHGYEHVDMVLDRKTKQIIFVGTRSNMWGQYILDIQTGKELSTQPLSIISGISGEDVYACVGHAAVKKVFRGDTVLDDSHDEASSHLTRRELGALLVEGTVTAETLRTFADNMADSSDAEVTLGFASGYRVAFELEQKRKNEKAESRRNIPTFDERTVFAKVVPFEGGYVVEGKEDAADRIVFSSINIAYDVSSENQMVMYGREIYTEKMMLLDKNLQPVTPGIKGLIKDIGRDYVQIDSQEYDFYGQITLTTNSDFRGTTRSPHRSPLRNYTITSQLAKGGFTGSDLADLVANAMGRDNKQFQWGFEKAYMDPEELRVIDQRGAVPWSTNPESIHEVEDLPQQKREAIMDALSFAIDDAPITKQDAERQADLVDYFTFAAAAVGVTGENFLHLLQRRTDFVPGDQMQIARRVVKGLPEKVQLSKKKAFTSKEIAMRYLEEKIDASRKNNGQATPNIIKDDTLPPPYAYINWREKLVSIFISKQKGVPAVPDTQAKFSYSYRPSYVEEQATGTVELPHPLVQNVIVRFVEGASRRNEVPSNEAFLSNGTTVYPQLELESAEPEVGGSARQSIGGQEEGQDKGPFGKGNSKSK